MLLAVKKNPVPADCQEHSPPPFFLSANQYLMSASLSPSHHHYFSISSLTLLPSFCSLPLPTLFIPLLCSLPSSLLRQLREYIFIFCKLLQAGIIIISLIITGASGPGHNKKIRHSRQAAKHT